MRKIDLRGRKFGNLLVLRQRGKASNGQSIWRCLCHCGELTTVRYSNLTTGSVKSCGCGRKGVPATHGATRKGKKHPLYQVYYSMLARCYDTNRPDYKYYGLRGVYVCEEWRRSFAAFFADMKNLWSSGLQLDRIDNSGAYSRSNCRFVTPKENSRNRRIPVKRKIRSE